MAYKQVSAQDQGASMAQVKAASRLHTCLLTGTGPLYKGTNPIREDPQNLISASRSHLLIPSNWALDLTMNWVAVEGWGGDTVAFPNKR